MGMGSSTGRRVLLALATKLGVKNDTLDAALHHNLSKSSFSWRDEVGDIISRERSPRWGSWAAVIDTKKAG